MYLQRPDPLRAYQSSYPKRATDYLVSGKAGGGGLVCPCYRGSEYAHLHGFTIILQD
jgi:hypothetical protein